MNPILRNILGVIAGLFVGGFLNSTIVSVGPLPEGVIPGDLESLKANIDKFELIHFLFPFLAHALGTLVSAFIAAKIATSKKLYFGLGVGAFTLLGGIAASVMIPAPVWFIATDLILAYLPMGWLGYKLATLGGSGSQQAEPAQ
ncbi:MAG: hypothetical protein H6581_24615 [Bacteroidia bacterium]|nr:hypothetical protein [Bacteroidia bacterium]